MKYNSYGIPVYSYRQDPRWPGWGFFVAVLAACLLLLFFALATARAEEWTDEQIAQAIYLAEGGPKAKIPYGILSVKVKDKNDAKRICLNTIRNNRKRFAKQSVYQDFLDFLGSRYAPVKGATNDPTKLNKNWVKNVRYFLGKGA